MDDDQFAAERARVQREVCRAFRVKPWLVGTAPQPRWWPLWLRARRPFDRIRFRRTGPWWRNGRWVHLKAAPQAPPAPWRPATTVSLTTGWKPCAPAAGDMVAVKVTRPAEGVVGPSGWTRGGMEQEWWKVIGPAEPDPLLYAPTGVVGWEWDARAYYPAGHPSAGHTKAVAAAEPT